MGIGTILSVGCRPNGRLRKALLAFLAVLAASFPVSASSPPLIPEEALGTLDAPVLILGDAATGTILAERNADSRLPPASLTKIMTLHLSLMDAEAGLLGEDKAYAVPPEGTAGAMRWGSSVLGLKEGDRATLLTLQRAAAVVSANDAAWSLAFLSSGGQTGDFVARMNEEALRLGMRDTTYADPDGWSSLSDTTGRDQWILGRAYLRAHPEVLSRLHSLPRMAYQGADSLDSRPEVRNTNLLLGRYPGADGLKTGTIPSAGFHFLSTAERDGTRLIALVMGIRSEDFREGLLARAREAAALLDLGFAACETWHPEVPEVAPVPVRHGRVDSAEIRIEGLPGPLTLEKGASARIEMHPVLPDEVTAPVEEGERIGTLSWSLDGMTIAEAPLVAAAGIERRWRLRDFLGL